MEDLFNRFGRVEKVTIVYDQRVSADCTAVSKLPETSFLLYSPTALEVLVLSECPLLKRRHAASVN